MLALLSPVAGSDVLELGCGDGYYTRALLDEGAGHVWAVDTSEAMLRGIHSDRVTRICQDAAAINLDQRFAVILAAGLLEFVPDPARVLEAARRHAQSDARLILLVPVPSLAGRVYRIFHALHRVPVALFGRRSLADIARATGWSVARWRRCGAFNAAVELRRVAGE